MPSSVWGYKEGDWVEWRPGNTQPWRVAKVTRFNTSRLPIVTDWYRGGAFVIGSPANIRPYEPPSTPDDIESFLTQ